MIAVSLRLSRARVTSAFSPGADRNTRASFDEVRLLPGEKVLKQAQNKQPGRFKDL
jgi:hypothetical protein